MQVVKDVQGCKGSKPAKLDVFECTVTPGIAGVRSRAATRETGGKARGRERAYWQRGIHQKQTIYCLCNTYPGCGSVVAVLSWQTLQSPTHFRGLDCTAIFLSETVNSTSVVTVFGVGDLDLFALVIK